ncbi:collagenase, partial [Streptomyces sp. NPDC058757]
MSQHRVVRSSLLATAIAVTLVASAGQAATRAAEAPAPRAEAAAVPGPFAPTAAQPNPFDEVERFAKARTATPSPAPAPGGTGDTRGRVPGQAKKADAKATAERSGLWAGPSATLAGVPCTLDGVTGLSPAAFADFLADPAVTAEGCLNGLIWTWDARLAPVMSDAHVQAVAHRVSGLAASHDGRNSSHLEEMFTYLHAVAYHDFSRTEIDVTDAPTVDAMRRA